MSNKNLATIHTITDIQSIPNANNIEIVTIQEWKCVTKKGDFKIGDKCVYITIDTIVPETPQFEFLRKVNFRVKTCRFCKQLSQGIVMPISILPNYSQMQWIDGQDVTELLGIKKYEKPIPFNIGSNSIKGPFPSYIPKTDEIMLQSIPDILKEINGKEVYISVKCDGTSATFGNFNGNIDVCSRNFSLNNTNNIYWQMFEKYNIDSIFEKHFNIAIQGEICGPSIQKNRLGLTEHNLFVFQIYDIKNAKYFDYYDFLEFCKTYNLQTVLIIKTCIFNFTMEEMIEMAKGVYPNGQLREGIVVRPIKECYSLSVNNYDDKLRGRMSFKVLNNDFLEKNKE